MHHKNFGTLELVSCTLKILCIPKNVSVHLCAKVYTLTTTELKQDWHSQIMDCTAVFTFQPPKSNIIYSITTVEYLKKTIPKN